MLSPGCPGVLNVIKMLKCIGSLAIAPACLLTGCGGSLTPLPIVKVSHGGTLVSLPNGRGFAEIVVETTVAGKSGPHAQVRSRIVVYFFQPDGTSGMNPAPTGVKVRLGRGKTGPVFDLSPQPKEAGMYATETSNSPYPDGFNGQLDFKVNGEDVHVVFFLL